MNILRYVLLALVCLGAWSCHPNDKTSPDTETKQETNNDKTEPPASTNFQIGLKSLAQRTPVIMYHDIVERRSRGTVWFDCTGDEFKSQMAEIKERGYRPVSLDDLYHHLTQGTPLPDKAIVLTFDDNYQGFYDIAWPILKQNAYPAVMFVHTGFVGKKTGRAHMSWDTLKELLKSPLMTVGSHTISHPELTKLDPSSLEHELTESKADLEKHLGIKVDYFAYPDGKNAPDTQQAAQAAGYTMSFSIENGAAEESPNIQCVNRYIQTRLKKAFDESERSMEGAVGVFQAAVKDAPVAYKEETVDGKVIAMVTGGHPVSVMSETREGVSDFINRTGAVAGINGTFFDMAAITATDNKLVGPCKTADASLVVPDNESWRWPKIRNRPVIMWGPTQAAIVPFDPPLMNDDQQYRVLMPDVTDVFLAGAWLVHSGIPRTLDQLQICSSKDIEDPRRRAAFGFLPDGTSFAAASKDSVTSSQFAVMLAKTGVQEAILLDSGFSTSLVYNDKVMASGHSTATTPSRPVPHAIVFQGTLDPASQAVAAAAIPATDPAIVESTTKHHRKRRRRRSRENTVKVVPDATAPAAPATPDAGGPPPPP